MKFVKVNVLLLNLLCLNGHNIVGYYTSWKAYHGYPPSSIPANNLTHLIYGKHSLMIAFAAPDPDTLNIKILDPWIDTDKNYEELNGFPNKGNIGYINQILKIRNPNLKTLLSIGGYTQSKSFSLIARNETKRLIFAQNCRSFIKKYGFDGLDVDWEYPVEGGDPSNSVHPNDGSNFSLLMAAIRKQFGKKLLLTAAITGNQDRYKNYDLANLKVSVDFFLVMTYNFRGPWSSYTGHQSPLYVNPEDPEETEFSAENSLRILKNQGVPKHKLLMGIVNYGQKFSEVDDHLDGLFQSFTPNYNIIEYNKINGSQNRHWDDISKSPWIYSPDDGIMISYDDVQSVTEKCHFVSNKNFGGFFFWELSQDIPSGQPNSLLDTVNKCVKGYHGGQNKSKCKAEVFPPNNSRFRDFPILNCPE